MFFAFCTKLVLTIAVNMLRFLTLLVAPVLGLSIRQSSGAPSVTVKNGTYTGLYQSTYDQDLFLGVPYAQPPVGDLRFRFPQPLNFSWSGSKAATAYYPECVGYGVCANPDRR